MKKTILFILFFPLVFLTEILLRYPFITLNFPQNFKGYHLMLFSIVTAIVVAVIMNYLNVKFRIHASSKFLLLPAITWILIALLSSGIPAVTPNTIFHLIFEMVIYMILVNNQFFKKKLPALFN